MTREEKEKLKSLSETQILPGSKVKVTLLDRLIDVGKIDISQIVIIDSTTSTTYIQDTDYELDSKVPARDIIIDRGIFADLLLFISLFRERLDIKGGQKNAEN